MPNKFGVRIESMLVVRPVTVRLPACFHSLDATTDFIYPFYPCSSHDHALSYW